MSVALYFDVHVPRAVADGLRLRGVDVLTPQTDRYAQVNDPDLLDRATTLGRVLVSQDEDLLHEAAQHQQTGHPFAGVIYAHQQRVMIGPFIDDLHLIATVYQPADMLNRVEYLPL